MQRMASGVILIVVVLSQMTWGQHSVPPNRPESANLLHPPSLASIVQGMEKAQSESRNLSAFQVIREYSLKQPKRAQPDSQVVAEVDFVPPSEKNYVIQRRFGSSRGEQLVRRILDHEVEMSRKRNGRSGAAVTSDNYEFRYLGTDTLDGQSCYVLQLIPRHKQKELISGQAWVDANTFMVRQMVGELAQSPSVWLKRVQVTLEFANVGGTWLQTGMQATADVRFLGPRTLSSKTLDYRSEDVVAARTSMTPFNSDYRGTPRH
jgi:outer membrane lipoprotein-sorting protein